MLSSSVSFFNAVSSIWSWIILCLISSISVGIESISVLTIAQASSTKSIALSGKNLSWMYLLESTAALINALSLIFTPWKTSYLSFSPRKIAMVSATVGSFTKTVWNLLSSAGSFSIYLWYSFSVVAPIQWSSPLASIGFNKFPASIAPSVLPAPTMVWSSSINRIILPSLFLTSFKTAFSLSSNSPLYFAPETKAPISSEKIVLFFRLVGTSPFTIRWARPSTIAVLPTPASPINTGLFLVFLESIIMVSRISPSRPITGSILFFFASSTRSVPYFFSALYVPSGLSVVTDILPRTLASSLIKAFLSTPFAVKSSFISLTLESNKLKNKCSTETYSSFICFAISVAKFRVLFVPLDKYTSFNGLIFGNLSICFWVSLCSFATLTPKLVNIWYIIPSSSETKL